MNGNGCTLKTGTQLPEVETFDPNKFDIRWDETYSMFRAVKLAWGAGNRSYVRYQCGVSRFG